MVNYAHHWIAHLDIWRARRCSIAYSVRLEKTKAVHQPTLFQSKAICAGSRGNEMNSSCVGGFAGILIVANYALISWSQETDSGISCSLKCLLRSLNINKSFEESRPFSCVLRRTKENVGVDIVAGTLKQTTHLTFYTPLVLLPIIMCACAAFFLDSSDISAAVYSCHNPSMFNSCVDQQHCSSFCVDRRCENAVRCSA